LKVRSFLVCGLALGLAACAGEPPVSVPTLVPQVAAATTGAALTTEPLPAQAETSTAPAPVLNFRTPEPTPTPAPSLRQLTYNGCCTQPFWSPDGGQVWFFDKPSDAQPSGVWGVGVLGGEPQFITSKIGAFSPDATLIAYPEAGQTIVERVATGERWIVPAGGRAIVFSPNGALAAWQAASSSANFDRRLVEIWVSGFDGSGERKVAQVIGGGLAGWFPDNTRLLISGRETFDSEPFLAVINLSDGAVTGVARGTNLRGALVSPGGGWVAYQVAFSGEASRDGLWIARTDGSEARQVGVFGAYRWRAEGRLLIVPLELNLGSHRVLEADAASGELRELTDPYATPFRITAGDWALSPDGNRLAFVNAADRNLWLLELPPPSP
jgi:Tol biopolymer transport system component